MTRDDAPSPIDDLIGFDMRDGTRRIRCAVSNEALEALSCLPGLSTTLLRRRSFDRFRTMINAAAALKISALPPGFSGPMVLNEGDLRRVTPTPEGAFGGNGRRGARARPGRPPAESFGKAASLIQETRHIDGIDATIAGEPLSRYLAEREAARRATGSSPLALEATLAGISDEVTQEAQEAIARRRQMVRTQS